MEREREGRKQEEKNKIIGEGRMVFPLLSPHYLLYKFALLMEGAIYIVFLSFSYKDEVRFGVPNSCRISGRNK
jgi:hypothetical protein